MAQTKEMRRRKNRERMRKVRAERIAKGLCPRCGKQPPRPNGKSCEQCHQEQHEDYLRAKRNGTHTTLVRRRKGLCIGCGNESPGNSHVYCKKCRYKRRKKAQEKKYGTIFGQALERDNFMCQLCGSDKQLHVHHIDGEGYGCENSNDNIENLITLCAHCHYGITLLRKPDVDRQRAVKLVLM